MPLVTNIPLPPREKLILNQSDHCVSCGAPRDTSSTLSISRLVNRGQRQEPLAVKIEFSHCQRCAGLTKTLFWISFIPFALGFVVMGGVGLLLTLNWAAAASLDSLGQPSAYTELILSGAAGLFAGLLGAFSFEVAARLLLLPIYGKMLWQAPSLTAQFFQNSDFIAGVNGHIEPTGRAVRLTFADESRGREFLAVNPELETSSGP